ncbi:hypothetical protein PI125_g27020 [Phytophthora idaei]|nr:hypothetical protein PI125_g27020 [Phytophthora idaei]
MGHTTRNATQDMTTTEGGNRDALEAQLLELQAEIKALREQGTQIDRHHPRANHAFPPSCPSSRGDEVKTCTSGSSESTHCVASTAMTPRTPT